MKEWKDILHFDPLPRLLSTENKAIDFFVKQDLLTEEVKLIENIWTLPIPIDIINKQQDDGSWKYPSSKKDIRTQENYDQLETYRQLGFLIEKYNFDNQHQAIQKAAEFLFSFQTEEGDFRGIYGNQYSPNYSAAIMELLIKAGYDQDPRVEKGFKWLLSIRQDDGGWTVPIRTNNAKWSDVMDLEETLQPNKQKPFSHMVTGVVLRAFAAHPNYRNLEDAKKAGELLASRFFKPDKYPDRKAVDYWFRVSFPFWFTDIVSSLDTLSNLGFTTSHPQIKLALNTLRERQLENGLWDLKLLKTKDKDLPLWVALAICRIFKKFY
ncbi:MAG: hypothetical protein ACFE75_13315 [Candidatus Hodarchaeota archaeon]